MNMYDVMYEAICDQYENGEITLEEAELLNDAAYDKYVVETSRETKAKRDRLYYGPNSVTRSKSNAMPKSKSEIRDRLNDKQDTDDFYNYYKDEYDKGYSSKRTIPSDYIIHKGKRCSIRSNSGHYNSSLKLDREIDNNGNEHEYYIYRDKFPKSKYSDRKKEILNKHNAKKDILSDEYKIKKAKRK